LEKKFRGKRAGIDFGRYLHMWTPHYVCLVGKTWIIAESAVLNMLKKFLLKLVMFRMICTVVFDGMEPISKENVARVVRNEKPIELENYMRTRKQTWKRKRLIF